MKRERHPWEVVSDRRGLSSATGKRKIPTRSRSVIPRSARALNPFCLEILPSRKIRAGGGNDGSIMIRGFSIDYEPFCDGVRKRTHASIHAVMREKKEENCSVERCDLSIL